MGNVQTINGEEVKNQEQQLMIMLSRKNVTKDDIENFIKKHNPNINYVNLAYETPLSRAIENNRIDIVELLIEKGVDVNKVTDDNFTPLRTAIENNRNLDIFKLLINAGADIRYVNAEGETYLMFACSKFNFDNNINYQYYEELFSILLDNISSKETNKEGLTCIGYIDHENLIKYFKELEYSLDLLNIIVNFYNSPIDNEIVDAENVYRHIIEKFLI